MTTEEIVQEKINMSIVRGGTEVQVDDSDAPCSEMVTVLTPLADENHFDAENNWHVFAHDSPLWVIHVCFP